MLRMQVGLVLGFVIGTKFKYLGLNLNSLQKYPKILMTEGDTIDL